MKSGIVSSTEIKKLILSNNKYTIFLVGYNSIWE